MGQASCQSQENSAISLPRTFYWTDYGSVMKGRACTRPWVPHQHHNHKYKKDFLPDQRSLPSWLRVIIQDGAGQGAETKMVECSALNRVCLTPSKVQETPRNRGL